MTPQLLSGARLIVSINVNVYGAGYVLDWHLGTDFLELPTIDIPIPAELVPNQISVSMNIRIYRTPNNDPVGQGISLPGDLSGNTFVNPSFTQFQYLTIQARDKVTDQPILYIPRAVVTARSGSVEAEDLLSETLTIRGIGFQNLSGATGLFPAVAGLF